MTRSRTATPRTREIPVLPPCRPDPLYRLGVMDLVLEYLTDEERLKRPRELKRSEVWG
jgi:hypothetical protein